MVVGASHHPDDKREIERMKAQVDAARTLLKEGMYNSALAALGGDDE
jgi:hypothetical protein